MKYLTSLMAIGVLATMSATIPAKSSPVSLCSSNAGFYSREFAAEFCKKVVNVSDSTTAVEFINAQSAEDNYIINIATNISPDTNPKYKGTPPAIAAYMIAQDLSGRICALLPKPPRNQKYDMDGIVVLRLYANNLYEASGRDFDKLLRAYDMLPEEKFQVHSCKKFQGDG